MIVVTFGMFENNGSSAERPECWDGSGASEREQH
jgi:hypothetical protein